MPDKAPWRDQIELLQNYPKHKTFTYTTTSGSAENAVVLAGNMEECNKVSFIVELGDAYVELDGDATATAMYGPQDEVYFDDAIWFGPKISGLRASSTNVRIRGILWGR